MTTGHRLPEDWLPSAEQQDYARQQGVTDVSRMAATAPKPLPSQAYLAECFDYDPATGILTWRERPWTHFADSTKAKRFNTKFAGRRVSVASRNSTGHFKISLDGKARYCHRVIWKLVKGVDPECVDHIDGDPLNNRITNLRDVPKRLNHRNTKLNKNNTSGWKGVIKHPIVGWNACITTPDGSVLTFYSKRKEEAIAWRLGHARRFGYSQRGDTA